MSIITELAQQAKKSCTYTGYFKRKPEKRGVN